ncbi:HAD-superfamily hydrolase, subfamily IA, variant 1 [Hyphomonas neptunium ATCC 15444]|uniref:HAD-superfamily hydrolase, subfamily IA, variant 1 n=2 Tax=Hyphomonas TaxID=85 RepID=Q0C003_HYPNA|nr:MULTISPECIES: HAD hydrolase-like protein [Hyphomonas]ABI77657.1 HAD-superfamily hydrolase, subfamily IA, variant 1 [Hyphomonas neptunium ATCC 15444]KCZ86629.1 HAD family hydrolase [Hyphomonas hirschiana VP5]
MQTKPDLIIFDFDGTLADSVSFFRALLPELSQKFRFRLPSHEEQEAMRGHPPREVMSSLGIPGWKLPMIAVYARKRARAAEAFPLFEGTLDLLDAVMAKGIPVAVVSSNAEAVVRRALGPEISSRISAWSCGAGMFGKAKHFRDVMKRLKADPARTLAVGDEIRDIDAAREVGICCVAVSWGFAPIDALKAARPDHAFDDGPALKAFLVG